MVYMYQEVRMISSIQSVYEPGLRFFVCMWFLSSGLESGVPQQAAHVPSMNVDFDAVFGTQGAKNDVKPAAGKIATEEACSSI